MEANLDERPGTRLSAPEPPHPPDRVIILAEELATPGKNESLRREAKYWLADIAK